MSPTCCAEAPSGNTIEQRCASLQQISVALVLMSSRIGARTSCDARRPTGILTACMRSMWMAFCASACARRASPSIEGLGIQAETHAQLAKPVRSSMSGPHESCASRSSHSCTVDRSRHKHAKPIQHEFSKFMPAAEAWRIACTCCSMCGWEAIVLIVLKLGKCVCTIYPRACTTSKECP